MVHPIKRTIDFSELFFYQLARLQALSFYFDQVVFLEHMSSDFAFPFLIKQGALGGSREICPTEVAAV